VFELEHNDKKAEPVSWVKLKENYKLKKEEEGEKQATVTCSKRAEAKEAKEASALLKAGVGSSSKTSSSANDASSDPDVESSQDNEDEEGDDEDSDSDKLDQVNGKKQQPKAIPQQATAIETDEESIVAAKSAEDKGKAVSVLPTNKEDNEEQKYTKAEKAES
jgi:hypothetical protein